MKKMFIPILFLLINSAFADLGVKDCLNVDNSKHFGPTRDQDGNGYCWAFTASALAEERLCKTNPSTCGKSVSPLDISRCDWKLNSEDEGGLVEDGLKCAIKAGVCSEDLAPFRTIMTLSCSATIENFLINLKKPLNWKNNFNNGRCERKKIVELFNDWRWKVQDCSENGVISKDEYNMLKKIHAKLVEDLREKVSKKLLSDKELLKAISNSRWGDDFLPKVLIGPKCAKDRKKISGSIVSEVVDHNPKETIKIIKEALGRKTSLGIGIDLGMIKHSGGSPQKRTYKPGFNHGLVLSGMRFNSKTKSCEIQLKNSWGIGADFNGWYPLRDIEGAIFQMTYLK